MLRRLATLLGIVVMTGATLTGDALAAEPTAVSGSRYRWVGATPAETLATSVDGLGARQGNDLARLLLMRSVRNDVVPNVLDTAFKKVAKTRPDLTGPVRWLRFHDAPRPAVPWSGGPAPRVVHPPGLLTDFRILGPLKVERGTKKPLDGIKWPDLAREPLATIDRSYGGVTVKARPVVPATVDGAGIPLDMYVHPRAESCTYLATSVRLDSESAHSFLVASAGAIAIKWDGAVVIRQDAIHYDNVVDRAAFAVADNAGEHLLEALVCSGAQTDSGRFRIHVVRADQDLNIDHSSHPPRVAKVVKNLGGRARKLGPKLRPQRTLLPLHSLRKTADDILALAIVRRHGRTDDLRSPRLSSILHQLATSKRRTVEHLALAGDLSRSASNRSARLRQAIDQSKAKNDAATRSFAERSLVESQLNGKQIEQARRTLLGTEWAPKTENTPATDAHAAWLGARTWSRRGVGSQSQKYRMLAAIPDGQRTPHVWRLLARIGPRGQRRQAWAQLRLHDRHVDDRAVLRARIAEGPSAFERAVLARVWTQESASDMLELGWMLIDHNRYATARKVLKWVTVVSPNLAGAWFGLSRQLRISGRDASADKALARALALAPGNQSLLLEHAFHQGVAKAAGKGSPPARVVESKVFLARAAQKPMSRSLKTRTLHRRRLITLHDDGRVSQLVQYAREIGESLQTEGTRIERLPFGNDAEIVLARVHRRTGTIEAPIEQEDGSVLHILWPRLRRGDIVEVALRKWTAGPVGGKGDAPFYFLEPSGGYQSAPIMFNEVFIDSPKANPIAHDVINGKPDGKNVDSVNGRTTVHLWWDQPQLVPDEPLAPPLAELVPTVIASIYPSWSSFSAWYQSAVEGFTAPDEQIRKLAGQLTAKRISRDGKISALFDFVADEIRYVNFRSGEWWLPNRPQQLLARKQGDCDDKAMLLISLLDAVGIEAHEVLVQTRHTGRPSVLRSDKVAVPMFDHGIVYIPDRGKLTGRYLDPTSPQSRVGAVPLANADTVVLNMQHPDRVSQVPSGLASDHGRRSTWTVTMARSGAARVSVREVHVGDSAFNARTRMTEPDSRRQWVEQSLLPRWLSNITVGENVTMNRASQGDGTSLKYAFATKSFARREGPDLVITMAPPTSLSSRFASLPTRMLPLELPPSVSPSHRDLELILEAPPRYTFSAPPENRDIAGGNFGFASIHFKRPAGNRKLTVTMKLKFSTYRIAPKDYAKWRLWLRAVDNAMRRNIRLKLE